MLADLNSDLPQHILGIFLIIWFTFVIWFIFAYT